MTKFPSLDVPFEAQGQTYTLRFSARCMAALQAHYKLDTTKQIAAKMDEFEAGEFGVEDQGVLMWAGLQTHHPDVTPTEAAELLDAIGPAAFNDLVAEAGRRATRS